ncbi:MAG: glycine cleavage system protein GcvH [Proteobacteria bacterium]|nr:glycine cleavage system protein GcvH [Pseudomonadota bacterium]MBU4275244.1 glycine cleavage system protein GcvH [Pseudomonadota bacterium]MBU4382521.1 glycine cleavage system protein GcvH [Pseudomonadota bacterium]MBU4603525.1 glycine cleavage system protein GcvH [Pseudomonadota bacterium]MCG2765038.1 glycine cleavage system protein GcvH [Desulfarculaceae bacterium]
MSEAKKAPEGLYYTKEHEWVKLEGDLAVVGLTDFAQDQLGDITYVELPEVEAEVEQMGEMCVVESVKTAADVYAPLSGVVAEVNSALEDAPELINQDCYGTGWLVKLSGFDQAELDNLMDAVAYVQLMAQGE